MTEGSVWRNDMASGWSALYIVIGQEPRNFPSHILLLIRLRYFHLEFFGVA